MGVIWPPSAAIGHVQVYEAKTTFLQSLPAPTPQPALSNRRSSSLPPQRVQALRYLRSTQHPTPTETRFRPNLCLTFGRPPADCRPPPRMV